MSDMKSKINSVFIIITNNSYN